MFLCKWCGLELELFENSDGGHWFWIDRAYGVMSLACSMPGRIGHDVELPAVDPGELLAWLG